ncbi:MAG TPA: IS110 family transposase [Methanomicrobia archaeon]|nr:IS110 family transposase [Methanomicrobia archaeon]
MTFAGVDLHKSFCQAIVCTHEGDVLKEGRIATEQQDIEEFFSGLEGLEIALEASTNYEYFYDLLESLGHHVVVAHPLKTRMIADAKVKTDKLDARILADLLRGDLLPTSYVPPKEQRELRHLVRHRIALGRLRGRLKTQIKTELRRKNVKYREGANCFTEKGKTELRRLHNPVIDSYLTIYAVVEDELKKMDRAIAEAGTRYEDVRLLTSIKGIGVYSALVIYSEIGDGSRFPTDDHVFSYAGLTPRVHQTGNEQYYGRITKEGSKYLRWILVEAARIHVQWCPESRITKHYEKIKRKRGEKIAIIAAARKLLQAIYYMLKHKEPFRIEG